MTAIYRVFDGNAHYVVAEDEDAALDIWLDQVGKDDDDDPDPRVEEVTLEDANTIQIEDDAGNHGGIVVTLLDHYENDSTPGYVGVAEE